MLWVRFVNAYAVMNHMSECSNLPDNSAVKRAHASMAIEQEPLKERSFESCGCELTFKMLEFMIIDVKFDKSCQS